MKKLLLLLSFVPALLWAQNTPKGFAIKGKVNGLSDGEVKITTVQEDHRIIASGTASGGSFAVNGSVPEPGLYFLVLSDQQPQYIFLDNSAITISGDRQDIKNIKIVGSPSHSDFVEFSKTFNPLFGSLNALAAGMEKEPNQKKREDMANQYKEQIAQVDVEVGKFVAAHRSSYVSTFLLMVTQQVSIDPNVMEARFNSIDPSVRSSETGKQLAQNIAFSKIGAVGTDAIDFTQNDVNGKPVTLSSFKGKYVLVDFWASWCRPCRAENPNVVKVYNKFKDKNFTILGVSLDQQKEAWVRAIQTDHLGWNHVSDLQQWNNAVAQLYHIQSIPGNFLIDPNGKIIAKDLRGSDLEQKLCQLFGGCN
jgi:peroxiredoxin